MEQWTTMPFTMKWNHSILQAGESISEWQAVDEAVSLAWELDQFSPGCAPDRLPSWPPLFPHRKQVSFSENVELRLVTDSPFDWADGTLSHRALRAWKRKPWKLYIDDLDPCQRLVRDLGDLLPTMPSTSCTWTSTMPHLHAGPPPAVDDLVTEPFSSTKGSFSHDVASFMQQSRGRRTTSRSRDRTPHHDPSAASSSYRPGSGSTTSWALFFLGRESYECDFASHTRLPILQDIALCTDEDPAGIHSIVEVESSVFELPLWLRPAIVIRHGHLADHAGRKFVLTDVIFHRSRQSPALFPKMHRSVRPFPSLLTRAELIDYAHLADVCEETRLCRVYFNDVLLVAGDPLTHHVDHGSYLLIHVAPLDQGRHGPAVREWLLDEDGSLCASIDAYAPDSGASSDEPPSSPVENSETDEAAFGNATDPSNSGLSPSLAPFLGLRVRTWFVSHTRARRCMAPRILFLPSDPSNWLQLVRTLWQDLLDPLRSFGLRLVLPTPPVLQRDRDEVLPHLIIEQDYLADHCAVLITALPVAGLAGHQETQFATSAPMIVNQYAVLQLLIPPLSADSTERHVYLDGSLMSTSSLVRLASGQGIEFRFAPHQHEEGEFASLLQTTVFEQQWPPPLSLLPLSRLSPSTEPTCRLDDEEAYEPWEPRRRPLDGNDRFDTPPRRPHLLPGTPDAVQAEILGGQEAVHPGLRREPAFVTWFLHGTMARACWIPRTLPVGTIDANWIAELQMLWADQIDHNLPLDYYFVRPSPPHNIGVQAAGHILVVQALPERCSALLLSQKRDESPWMHHAFIGPSLLTKFDLLSEGAVTDECVRLHYNFNCLTRFAGVYLSWSTTLAIDNGANLVLDVTSRLPQTPPLTVWDIGVGPTAFWTAEHSDALQALRPEFLALDDVQRHVGLPVTTWYIHHLDQLRCHESRLALLPADFASWELAIAQVWVDKIHRGEPCHFHIVNPLPIDTGHRPRTVHVIVSQADPLAPDRRGIVISSSFDWDHWNIAISSLVTAIPETIMWQTNNLDRCSPSPDGWDCHVFHGDRELAPGHPMFLEHGMNILLQGTLRGYPADALHLPDDASAEPSGEESDDASSFLQGTHSGNGRQRTGLVAHTQSPSPCQASRQKLHLVDLLEEPRWTTTRFDGVIHFYVDLLKVKLPLLTHWPGSIDWTTPHGVHWTTLPVWDGEPPLHFAFYTDGSRLSNGITGSGVALVVTTPAGLRAGGMLALRGPTGWAGLAEHHAMCWALLWAIHLGHWAQGQLTLAPPSFSFHYDATVTGNLTAGAWHSHSNRVWHLVLRSLAQLLTAAFGSENITWEHVYAHQGNTYNELVDDLAKYGSSLSLEHNAILSWLESEDALLRLQWLWLLVPVTHQHPAFPQLVDDCLVHQLTHRPIPCQTPEALGDTSSSSTVTANLRIASANVLTLDAPREDAALHPGSRQQLLMTQFRSQGFHLVALQETRHRQARLPATDDFAVIGHAADSRGHGGIQLWLNVKDKFAPNLRPFRLQDCALVDSEPEWMICKLRHPALRCVLVIAHGPHAEHGDDACASFWDRVTVCLKAKCRHWKVIYLGDPNAHLGSVTSDSIGPHQAEIENVAGTAFHDWLQLLGLWAPSTFKASHEGDGHTFLHPAQGHWRRLDYICLDSTLPLRAVRSWVATSIDISVKRTDHLVIACDLSLQSCRAPVRSYARQPQRWDVQQWLGTADATHRLQQALALPPPSIDVHTHAALLCHSLSSTVKEAVPVSTMKPLKRTLTEETWQLLQEKQIYRKKFFRLHRHRQHRDNRGLVPSVLWAECRSMYHDYTWNPPGQPAGGHRIRPPCGTPGQSIGGVFERPTGLCGGM
eukprot:Skav224371  [mRNA]  locus=scaffold2603:36537:43068:+ [translate_table: standard]